MKAFDAAQPAAAQEAVDFYVCDHCGHHYMDDGVNCDCIPSRTARPLCHVRMAPVDAAPGIDLAQFREAVAHWKRDLHDDYKGGHIHDGGEAMRKAEHLLALIDASPKGGISTTTDSDRIDFIESEFLHIEPVEIRASEDDSDVGWVISQHHMRKGLVELIRWDDDNLRSAIDAAMQATSAEVGA